MLAARSTGQSSAIVLPHNLAELVSQSDNIIQGWVTNVSVEPNPQLTNLNTVAVTLQIEETLKGSARKTYTFHQAVIDRRDLERKMGYRPGQHLLLLLIKPSRYGLSSPAGLEQGRFYISPGQPARSTAMNGTGNAALFRGLQSQMRAKGMRITPQVQSLIASPSAGPLRLDDLKLLIRTIAAAN